MSRVLCGCYYYTSPRKSFIDGGIKCHLPLVESEVYASILSTNSNAKLHQTFTNNTGNAISECIYAFPLYDGVSVVSFTCNVAGRLLRGIVKEKNAARTTYHEAIARGETAGLLEQLPEASDTFTTKLGNVPAGETVIMEIEYVGELKQDAEMNGIRFTIPTSIAPRYGSVSSTTSGSSSTAVQKGSFKIVVDAQMPSGSFIQGIQSPSHPIAVTMGTTSVEPQMDPSMTKASATLALGETGLDKDFVLIVLAKDNGIPKALLETHPTIPNQRALMLTLMPKFSLPPSRPEIVFVADRSGSMRSNIGMLISAMNVLLKSMPLGVKFDICSFGSSHSFLFSKSMSYTQDTLAAAVSHVEGFSANMGGTETFSAVRATIERRFKDIPLEIILLTDGDIWQQEELFTYLNDEVEKSKGDIRVFPLGIGNGVSHALIEGIARAGNGFSQAVQQGEKFDNRLVRMLKGALSPHVTDYSLEVKYEVENEDDEFEMVDIFDKVTEGLKYSLAEVEKEKPKPRAPLSLFDTNEKSTDKETPIAKGDRYADLPNLPPPKLIQAPHKIPSLFPFNRTTVYLLMAPGTVQKNPSSVVLRGTSAYGPLKLEIPVEVLSTPAETVHQLAARKAMQELEEGRGWIFDTKDDKGIPLKEKLPSKFSDMIEREAVRLGVQFGIAGKWCSFVAVAENDIAGNDGKEQAEFAMAHVGKSEAELHIVDGSQGLKRKASAATSDRLSKYHALRGISLGQRDRRFVTRPPGAGPGRSPSDMSNVLVRSNLRELAAINGSLLRTDQADRCVSTDTNTGKNRTAGMPGLRQRMSNGLMAKLLPSSLQQQPPASSGKLYQSPLTSSRSAMAYAPTSSQQQPLVGNRIALCGGSSATPTRGGPVFGSPINTSSTAARKFASHRMAAYRPAMATRKITTPAASKDEEAFASYGNTGGGAPAAAASIDYLHPEGGHQQQSDTSGSVDASDSEASNAGEVSTFLKGIETSDSDSDDRALPTLAPHRSAHPEPSPPPARSPWVDAPCADKVLRIIALQGFEGWWDWHADMLPLMGLGRAPGTVGQTSGKDRKVWVTVLVVAWLREAMRTQEEVWELVVEKATAWLAEAAAGEDVVAMGEEAKKMIRV
ncbi:hypothetical protein MMC15_006100 [Xylographa vitiligo]|nr:hypothetical protein [Xylographa vitiligo]